jgi:hypothetical protein
VSNLCDCSSKADVLQLNEYETDPYFLWLSHHLTSYCFRIYEDLHRLQHLRAKLFYLLFLNNFCSHVQKICVNLHKYWNNAISNHGSSIEIIDQSHGTLQEYSSWISNASVNTVICFQGIPKEFRGNMTVLTDAFDIQLLYSHCY